jgi:phosphoenolpyruvate---glycerone phosphotransferase subunit DhaL
MSVSPALIPDLIQAAADVIRNHAEEIAALDQAIGDGDHVVNLQRGLDALIAQGDQLAGPDWADAFQKIGMSVMSTVGGASGSLYGTLFLSLSKAVRERPMTLQAFAEGFLQGVEAVKMRGKADLGEKTMLDVLIPVARTLKQGAESSAPVDQILEDIRQAAEAGVESTRDLLATKGRASFLGERARGHLDAGAKSSQVMIGAIVEVLRNR